MNTQSIVVSSATGTVTIIGGEITAVNLDFEGQYYTRNFITFYGGGGQGGRAFAKVKPLAIGGGIESIAMLMVVSTQSTNHRLR